MPNEYIKLNLSYTKFPAYFLYFVPKIVQLYITTLLFPEVLHCLHLPLSEGRGRDLPGHSTAVFLNLYDTAAR
jgi:hypothetical protein